jgi:predicted Zn-dependent protease
VNHLSFTASRPRRFLPLLSTSAAAAAGDRPVMTRDAVTALSKRIMTMTSVDTVEVFVTHTARVITRLANDRILAGDDGDEVEIYIMTRDGGRDQVRVETNQITESTLRALVHQCETLARGQVGSEREVLPVPQVQDHYPPVQLWHDSTVRAMSNTRDTTVPALIDGVTQHGLRAAGFLGCMARATAVLSKDGIHAFCDETDSEVTVTARGQDGKSSGWSGQAARDWSRIDAPAIVNEATRIALMSKDVQALEPGRRTVILGPGAVVQLARYFALQLDAKGTDMGETGFSKSPRGGNKLRQRVFDPQIHMSSDPADPDGGYRNFFGLGLANRKMTWIADGVLKNLSYDMLYAMARGKEYTESPSSLRIGGGTSSLEHMIASCQEGVYVNRFSSVDMLDKRTGMMTGVTRDGCFLIKDGKIDRAVKNFRFRESPFFMFNKLVALGPAVRTAFGYTPPSERYEDPAITWPRPPMIVPPMMVRDFNFSSLSDAV